MNNIFDAQDAISDFFTQHLLADYSFDDWKNYLVLTRTGNIEAVKKKWDVLGEEFSLVGIDVDIQASSDKWAPCLCLTYKWIVKNVEVLVRIILVKDEPISVNVMDMFSVLQAIGEKCNLAKEFKKNIALMYTLKH